RSPGGELDHEGGSSWAGLPLHPVARLGPDPATVEVDEPADHSQPQAQPLGTGFPSTGPLDEGLEDPLQEVWLHPLARVAHLDEGEGIARNQPDLHHADLGELDRVVKEIDEDLAQ